MAATNRNNTRASWGVVPALIVPLLLGNARGARAAEPPPALDTILSRAMDRNPAIITARAKVALAQAELSSTRLEVARQVIAAWGALPIQEQVADMARKDFQRVESLYKGGAASTTDFDAAKRAVIDADAKLSRMRGELRYLTGEFELPGGVVAPRASAALTPSQGPSGDPKPVLAALRDPIGAVNFEKIPLDDVLGFLESKTKISITRDPQATFRADTALTIRLKSASLGELLQAIEDQVRGSQFVVRDYGLLVTDRDRAIQERLQSVAEFIRDHAASRERPAPSNTAPPPPKQ